MTVGLPGTHAQSLAFGALGRFCFPAWRVFKLQIEPLDAITDSLLANSQLVGDELLSFARL